MLRKSQPTFQHYVKKIEAQGKKNVYIAKTILPELYKSKGFVLK